MRKCRYLLAGFLLFVVLFFNHSVFGKNVPSVITIGTLYASNGPFKEASKSQLLGLQFWIHTINSRGGVFVKAFNKRIPLKLITYDDHSSAREADALYNRLITQDRVDILVADFGSVLTSVAIPLAREHKILLFDVTGTSAKFFVQGNSYIVLCSLPTSGKWPYALADFIIKNDIQKIAIVYSSNDFDSSQAITLHKKLQKAKVKIVYYKSIPSDTSDYSSILKNIKSKDPNMVIELGYPNNDISFLNDLKNSGLKFDMVFTVFPGQLFKLLKRSVGLQALAHTYTYPTPPFLRYNKEVTFGMRMNMFEKRFRAYYNNLPPNFLNVAGYNAGLIIQKTLATSDKFNQLSFRKAVMEFSGRIFTLNGLFKVDSNGAQVGEVLPVAQFVPDEKGQLKVNIIYPRNFIKLILSYGCY